MSKFYFEFVEMCCIVYIISVILYGLDLSSQDEKLLNMHTEINVTSLLYISISFIGIMLTFIANWSTSLMKVELGKAIYLFLETALLGVVLVVTIYNPIITVKSNIGIDESEFIKLFDIYLFDIDGAGFSFFDEDMKLNVLTLEGLSSFVSLELKSSSIAYAGSYFAAVVRIYSAVLSPCIIYVIAMFMARSLINLVTPEGNKVLWAFLSMGRYISYSDFNRRCSNKLITDKQYWGYIGVGVFLFLINYVFFPFMAFIDAWDKSLSKYILCNASSFFLMFVGIILLVYKTVYNNKQKQRGNNRNKFYK